MGEISFSTQLFFNISANIKKPTKTSIVITSFIKRQASIYRVTTSGTTSDNE